MNVHNAHHLQQNTLPTPLPAPSIAVHRIHSPLQSYFFSSAPPQTYVKNLLSRTFSLVRSFVSHSVHSLFVMGKDTCLKVYGCFVSVFSYCLRSDLVANFVTRIISYFLKDTDYKQKIDEYKQYLENTSGTTTYAEAVSVVQQAIEQGFDTYVMHAKEVDKEVRPQFVSQSILLETEPNHFEYRLFGKLSMQLVQKNEALFKKALECNLLKVFCNVVDRFSQIDKENKHPLCDLVLDVNKRVSLHFSECKNQEELIRKGSHTAKDPKLTESNKKLFFQILAASIMNVCFPHGAEDIDLPFSPRISSFVSGYIHTMMKNDVLPNILESLFAKQSTPYCKNYVFHKLFTSIHKGIDEPQEPLDANEPIAIEYPRQKELVQAIDTCMHAFLEYIDPGFLPWILKAFALDAIAEKAGDGITQKLQHRSLEKTFRQLLEKALPLASFTFETCVQQRQETLMRQQRKNEKRQKKIAELVETIGKDPQGLKQLIQKGIIVQSEPTTTTSSTSSLFSRAMTGLYSLWGTTSQAVVHTACSLSVVSSKIQTINRTIWEKMRRKQHEGILFDVTRSVVYLLQPKIAFPNPT